MTMQQPVGRQCAVCGTSVSPADHNKIKKHLDKMSEAMADIPKPSVQQGWCFGQQTTVS